MQAVVFAAGKGTRLRPLTADKPKALVEVAGKPMLTDCFERLCELDASELIVVVGYRGQDVIDRYGDEYGGIPITYAWQDEQKGMAHALLQAEEFIDGPFMGMDGDGIVRGDLRRCVEAQHREDVDSTLLLDRVSPGAAAAKAVCELNERDELVRIVNKPDEPTESLVAASFHTFTPAIFDACRRVERSSRGEYELSDAIGLLVEDGKTVLGVEHDGWLVNVNTPEERRVAERRLQRE